ncbi:MAG: hypothetical protein M3133_03675, partial [Actinomycetota bacterium]|nr:hypothetical protein [Actinomycetota bacterium]
VLAGACAANDPRSQLERALESTQRTSYAYEFVLQADKDTLSSLGPLADQARLFLQGLNVSGHRTPERNSVAVRVLGIDAFELRSIDEDTLYLRFGFDELSRMLGEGDSSDQMARLLRQRGLSDEAIAAVGAAFRGEWLGVEGGVEASELGAVLASEVAEPTRPQGSGSLREALGGDAEGFVERYVIVNDVSGSDDERVFGVSFRVRDLVMAVASVDPASQERDRPMDPEALPELAPGTVTVRDGVITNVVADLAETARTSGETGNATTTARLEISQHGEVGDIEAPPATVTITDEQFLEALAAVSGLVEDLVPPMPAESAR